MFGAHGLDNDSRRVIVAHFGFCDLSRIARVNHRMCLVVNKYLNSIILPQQELLRVSFKRLLQPQEICPIPTFEQSLVLIKQIAYLQSSLLKVLCREKQLYVINDEQKLSFNDAPQLVSQELKKAVDFYLNKTIVNRFKKSLNISEVWEGLLSYAVDAVYKEPFLTWEINTVRLLFETNLITDRGRSDAFFCNYSRMRAPLTQEKKEAQTMIGRILLQSGELNSSTECAAVDCLMIAIEDHDTDMVQLLMQSALEVFFRDQIEAAFQKAKEYGHKDIITLLTHILKQ